MKNIKEHIVTTVTLFLICLIATLLLGVTNSVTSPIIEKLAIETEKNSRKVVFETAEDFINEKQVDEATSIVEAVDKDGNKIGYVVVNTAKGYGGDISVMTGVDIEGKVTGVNILSHSETAGLGAKATTDGFKNQFIGHISGITVSKDKAGDNAIDAITGATITSRAVTNAINAAIELTGGESIG